MDAGVSHFKLGLLVLATVAALVTIALALGFRSAHRPAIGFETYFDESVDGLEPGATVRYRGVRVGNVSSVGIARDRRFVTVGLAIDESEVDRLQLTTPAPDLRAELSTQGITGVKFVDLDFSANDPPPQLPFAPSAHYIPSRVSFLTRLARRSESISDQASTLMLDASLTLHHVATLLDELDREHLAARAGQMVDRGESLFTDARRLLAHIDSARVADHANAALDRAGAAVADSTRAVNAIDELARRTLGASDQLQQTLRDIGDAARGVRDFLDELDREPDMLVKGRAKAKGP